jgi:hypothetical protein
MKLKICIFILSVLCLTGFAQADDFFQASHQRTSLTSTARFEILQSSLAAKWTFRLDRYSGRVWQLVQTKDDDLTWEEMTVINLPKIETAAKPRFQLFTSGLAARHTFLMDNETGKTWVVVTSKRTNKDGSEYDINIWQPFVK